MADKWEWQAELVKAHVTQAEVGGHLGMAPGEMSRLAKKMIQGKGLTATATDKRRWDRALSFIEERQAEVSR